ncbi:SAV_2336 N-terminal domain-related protein [Streptomyces sp. NPDC002033]|uniref:SAV_2336 N-terminal domain-related protein n=1 Tax=unclassified Streptomyces TaxID=2593676 RepID=UPI00332DA99C
MSGPPDPERQAPGRHEPEASGAAAPGAEAPGAEASGAEASGAEASGAGGAELGIRVLAGLLRGAGLDPGAGELADALWLAGHTRPAVPSPAAAAPPEPVRAGPGGTEGDAPGEPAAETGPAPRPREEADPEDPVRLYAAGARQESEIDPDAEIPVGGGVPVRVPGAAALPRILDIQRALRALQRHRPPGPPARTVLDESATAEASARALGLVIPVLRPESRREATVRLVMDASPSMAVWQEMFEELRSVCERLGAFRDVQAHYLHRLADGTAAVGRGPSPGGALRSGDQLRDPTGRVLTMVVSDCAGPVWREGEAQRLLHRWAQCSPCVVVQPLPQRLWSRSWLPTERGVLERADGGGGGGGAGGGMRLRFRSERPPRPGQRTGGLTVPVLPPHATALGAWARLVAGLGTGPVPAEVGRVLARHPAAPVPLPRTARPPGELVRRFRSSAAPGAVQLAVYLAAAPLTLPVMRLVQRTMLPDSEPSDLAEVLLSGLLRRSGETPGQWYEFVPGVQDVLLGPLGRDEAALVLKHCSEYVLAHFGRGVRNFPALAVSQLTGIPAADPEDEAGEGRVPAGRLPQAFAHVSAKVVRRYLPGPPQEDPDAAAPLPDPDPDPEPPAPARSGRAAGVRAARERLADGDARALYEAAALLRHAVAVPARPGDPPEEAETELAGALLRLWALQRDPELLDEAERAVAGLDTPPAGAARGRVLYERALAGAPDAELLAAADREFAVAGAAAAAGPELRLDCAVRRARTLIRLSALRDDAGPLHEARAALEALAAPGPGPDAHPEPDLALGRVLLALLPHTPDPAARTALAERAAAHLTAALTALLGRGPEGPPGPAPARGGPGGPGGNPGAPDADADAGGRTGTAPASVTGSGAAPSSAPGAPGASGGAARSGPVRAPDGGAPPHDAGPGAGRPPAGAGGGAGPDDASGGDRAAGAGPARVPEARGPDAGGGVGSADGSGGSRAAGAAAARVPEAPGPDAGDGVAAEGAGGERAAGAGVGLVSGAVAGDGGGARGSGAGAGGGAGPDDGSGGDRAAGAGAARGPEALGSGAGDGVGGQRAAGAGAARGPGARGAGAGGGGTARRVARVRVDLAEALRHLPARLEEAAGHLVRALVEAADDPGPRLAALVCLARVHRARYARDGDPAALDAAADAYGRARRLIPRDEEAFGELLPEWGDVLLDRARHADGRAFASTAVRVLRESRAAVPQSDPRASHRLLRLAAGLRLRHSYEGDLVDLREAEYLLELAARPGHRPLERALAWREHGDVQQEIHAHTRAADRLDRAADSYRRAWRAALEADPDERRSSGTAVRLAARVQELRGEVLERLARPRAALDAYRAALELRGRLDPPEDDLPAAIAAVAVLQERIRVLEEAL